MIGTRLRRRFGLASRSGNFATMTALFAPVAIGLCAVAVDAASLYVERRRAQSLADLAAITAAASVASAQETARLTFLDNGVSAVVAASLPAGASTPTISVVSGRYVADDATSVGARFAPGASPANAVRVAYAHTGTRHFASGLIPPPRIAVAAIASQTPEAAFSIGTRLASLNGGLVNSVLGAMLGANLSLSLVDYNSLVSVDVGLFSFLDQLAIEIGVTAGTYDDLLVSDASIGDMAAAASRLPGLSAVAQSLLAKVAASAASDNLDAPLAGLIDLGGAGRAAIGSNGGGLAADVGLLDILSAGAAIANGGRQLEMGLGAGVPGLVGVSLHLATGEPPASSPWLTYAEKGRMVRTAQTRALLSVEISGPGGLIGASVKLPIYIELASAEATLSSVSCPTGRLSSAAVDISARTAAAELRIAHVSPTAMDDFTATPVFGKAELVKTPVVTIKGKARVAIENGSPKTVSFDASETANRDVKSVSTTSLLASLTTSLIEDLDLDISVAGLGIGLPGIAGAALSATLQPVAPAVDGLIFAVLDILGVRIGEADIRILGVDCGRPVLVQ